MTPDQMDIALAFKDVSFPCFSSMKRAAMTFLAMAQGPGREVDMTILQEEYLYLLAIKFRRQLPVHLVATAARLLKIIQPLVIEERENRRREAYDKQALREAKKRARAREHHQASLWLTQVAAMPDKTGAI